MRRNETLLQLARLMGTCSELNLPCERAVYYCSTCINEMADNVIVAIDKLLNKPEIRSCRIPLVIDFNQMTNVDYWLKSKIFSMLSLKHGESLKLKIVLMTNKLNELQARIMDVDNEYAEKLFKRMMARQAKSVNILNYEIWKAAHPHPTMKQLEQQQAELTFNMLTDGILAYDTDPYGDEMEMVRLDLLTRLLKYNKELPKGFVAECAKLRRYSYWEGEHMFMINYHLIYNYLFTHCFEKLTKKQRIKLFEYDVQLRMIHRDMVMINPDLAKYLKGDVPQQDIVDRLKPIFYNNEVQVRLFLKEIVGMPPNDVTDLVNKWVQDNRISDYGNSRKGILWSALKDANLYNKSRQNWCRRVF